MTTSTLTLAEFLLARIAEDEWWAHESSRRDDTYVESGTHWQWVYSDDDAVADLDPARDPYLGGNSDHGYTVSLRSIETFPTVSVGPLPQFAISRAEEVTTVTAEHIARHDPARVLAECEAKRQIVERCLDVIASFGDWDAADAEASGGRVLWTDVNRRERSHAHATLHDLASVYADHPDYRQEWRP